MINCANYNGFDCRNGQLEGIDWSKVWNFAKPILKTGLSFIPGVGGFLSEGVDVVENLVGGADAQTELARLTVQGRTSEAIQRAQQQGQVVNAENSMAEVIYQALDQVLSSIGVPAQGQYIVDAVNTALNISPTQQQQQIQPTQQQQQIQPTTQEISTSFREGIDPDAIVLSKKNIRLNGIYDDTYQMIMYENDDMDMLGQLRRSGGNTVPVTTTTPTTPTTPTKISTVVTNEKQGITPVPYEPQKTKLICQVIGGTLPGSIKSEMQAIRNMKEELQEGIYLLEKEKELILENRNIYAEAKEGESTTTPTLPGPSIPTVDVTAWLVPENQEISKVQFVPIHIYSKPFGSVAYVRYDAPREVFSEMVTRWGYTPNEINRFYPQGYDDDRWQIIPVSNVSFTNNYLPYLSTWQH